jgi:glycosyltransferase involved in cell wall biosynthesis
LLGRKTGDRTYTRNLVRALARLDCGDELIVYLNASPDEATRELLAEGCHTRVIERPRGYRWMLHGLPPAARRDRLDVLHVQYMLPFDLPCPTVTTIHDVSFRLFPRWFRPRDRWVFRLFLPGSLRRAAMIVAPSECTARDLVACYGVPEAKIAVTPEAPSEEFAAAVGPGEVSRVREAYDLPPEFFLFVGNRQPRTNVPRLVRAFCRARAEHGLPQVLVLVGQVGWLAEEAEREIERASRAGDVRVLGYVPDGDLPPLFAAAQAFLFPPLYEGFGLPVVEAMAVGTPVLTSSTSALAEVAGDAALLVDPEDEQQIAEGIVRLAGEEALRETLRERGLKRAASFNWRRTAELTREAYQRAVQSSRG